jgi:hypothetical protein
MDGTSVIARVPTIVFLSYESLPDMTEMARILARAEIYT